MASPSLKRIVKDHRSFIFEELLRRLALRPQSPYLDFAESKEGHQRIKIWIENIILAIDGQPEIFLSDTEKTGYLRAHQGFKLDFIAQFYRAFHQIVWEILKEESRKTGRDLSKFTGDLHELHDILLQGLSIVTGSYLNTREEIINEKVTQLQQISAFTHEIISKFAIDDIARFVLKEITGLFGADKGVLFVRRDTDEGEYFFFPGDIGEIGDLEVIVENTLKDKETYVEEAAAGAKGANHSADSARIVSIPVHAHGRGYGVLVLVNLEKGLLFGEKERQLLHQFLYIIVIALNNAFMLEEIVRGRREMQLLAGNTIAVQEEERRRLAGDIHDTITQSLTGIGYKLQYCKELIKKDPERLAGQFDTLVDAVHRAVDQSREIMSNLRPDLIDTLGLVAALKRHIENFSRDTGIRVETQMPGHLQLSAELNICLFRMVQEALMNVYKHASVSTAEVVLKELDGALSLTVSDRGRGFDNSPSMPVPKNKRRMGLLILKERVESVGGHLSLQTAINKGCRLEANIPLEIRVSSYEKDRRNDCRRPPGGS